MIILEGMDNSGKSTAGRLLSLPVFNSGSRPKNSSEFIQNLLIQQTYSSLKVVVDRLTCISDPIYSGKDEGGFCLYARNLIVRSPSNVIIYCRPPIETILDFSKHVRKEYDTDDSIKSLQSKAIHLIESYDILMSSLPHLVYNYTLSNSKAVLEEAKELLFDEISWHYWYINHPKNLGQPTVGLDV